jgi:hypothetical protein
MTTYRYFLTDALGNAMKVITLDRVLYRLHDGSWRSPSQLRTMFMGKVPSPAQRKMLGIEKLHGKKVP